MSSQWKRLITFVAVEDHQIHSGEPVDEQLDIGQAYGSGQTIQARLLSGPVLSPSSKLTGTVLTVKVLLSPLNAQEIGSARCLGANYVQPGQDDAEAKKKRPVLPILFYKPPTALNGPEGIINIPKAAKRNGDETDYEVELGVILSQRCRDVSASDAPNYILGYTLTNDVSYRKRMFAVPQWGLGKSFDGSLPIGPVLVSPTLIPNPENVCLSTYVDGEKVQDGNTSGHLWKVFETISELSSGTTLPAGTLISMGTPPGEGFKQNPQRWLQHGQEVVVKGGNGLGSLRNHVREEGVKSAVKARL